MMKQPINSFQRAMSAAFVLRLGLMLYGEWQDRRFAVKYTDVDYNVFTDAAKYMLEGSSPYNRPTYRYTPILAWMLQPNIYLSPMFGKFLFVVFDIFTGYLIYEQLLDVGAGVSRSLFCANLWYFNPITMAVTTRGNAESIMTFLVLMALKFLLKKQYLTAGILYALSIHFKIYPVIFALPLYLFIDYKNVSSERTLIGRCVDHLWPTRNRFIFVFFTGLTLFALTAAFYRWYGWEFLDNAYLYHVTRSDIRHNFSVYFYMQYLVAQTKYSRALGLLSFLPQLVVQAALSVKFYRDPPMSLFFNTFAFVAFNKVCTAQYFLWYLSLLPLILPSLKMTTSKAASLFCLWGAGQALWLLPAYYLEFEGMNTFSYIWLAGIVFFFINVYIIISVINDYAYTPWTLFDSKRFKEKWQ